VVHLHYISSITEYEIFHRWLSSWFAVKGFFAVSGYLVALSFVNSQSLTDFAERRVRRIVPAYMFIIFLSLIVGAIFSLLPLDQFVSNPLVWKYVASNVTFLNFLQPTLPGVFNDHFVRAMNPSLWTIKIEICLYVCLPLIIWTMRRWGVWACAILLYGFSVYWSQSLVAIAGEYNFWAELARQFPGQLSFFVIGAALAMSPVKNTTAYVVVLLSGVTWLLGPTMVKTLIEPIFFSFSVITVATMIPYLGNFGRFGDLSYGTYLYHSFVIHVLHELGVFGQAPILGFILCIALILTMAFCSWRWIEKPLLKRTPHKAMSQRNNEVGYCP
jgi:peptidoglycan/LPS O-acetylase OafA/YrhL